MNSVIRTSIKGDCIRLFELHILSNIKVDLFLPLSYELKEGEEGEPEGREEVIIYSDITETEPLLKVDYGGEAPYIASDLMNKMEEAMFKYMLPWHYKVNGSLLRGTKNRGIKLIYEPEIPKSEDIDMPGTIIRKKTALLIKEIFGTEDIVGSVIDLLEDESIGFETCKRRMEKLKEEVFFLRPDSPFDLPDLLDLYGEIV